MQLDTFFILNITVAIILSQIVMTVAFSIWNKVFGAANCCAKHTDSGAHNYHAEDKG